MTDSIGSSSGIGPGWLIDLIELCGSPAEAAGLLRRLASAGSWPVPCGAFDSAGLGALRHHLSRAGLVTPADSFVRPDTIARVDAVGCHAAATAVELVADAVGIANSRRPSEPSRLVVTATTDSDLRELSDRLGVRRLWNLVEDTIRSAETSMVLGAPYWNHGALERLRPALEGARSRDVSIDFVVQGGARSPSVALDALHAFAHQLRQHRVPTPGFDTVTIWQFDADALAARHIALHAKFAIADRVVGYLGSANMTDQGLEINFEIGALLGPRECEQLLGLLDGLRTLEVLRRA